jgi:hypothetical protein
VTKETTGELRLAKGALLFVPDGTDLLLRVEARLALPASFKRARAALTLQIDAEDVAASTERPGLSPPQGVPERIVGDVAGRDPLVVDAGGVLVHIVGATATAARVAVTARGPLRAVDARLL